MRIVRPVLYPTVLVRLGLAMELVRHGAPQQQQNRQVVQVIMKPVLM